MNFDKLMNSKEVRNLSELMNLSGFRKFVEMVNDPIIGQCVTHAVNYPKNPDDNDNKTPNEGWAKITASEGADPDTYVGEFVDSLLRNGYSYVVDFREKSPIYYIYFTKNLIRGTQNA